MKQANKDRLIKTYSLIRQLREKGVKMKDIAEATDVTSSVLSALYSTVLPTFSENISEGMDDEKALSQALLLVNNISKKKLFDIIELLESRLHMIDFRVSGSIRDERLFFSDIEREAMSFIDQAQNYSGIYLAYSRSSYKDALKIEPYIIQDIQKGEIMPRIGFKNELGQEYWGVAVFSAHQMGYVFINEQKNRKLGLRAISLQLPLFDRPSVLKGIYLSHDYNHNPIARRIVFIKYSDSTDADEMRKIEAKLVAPSDLTEEQQSYYNYTCCKEDYICSFMCASPEPNKEDLIKEKLMLKI